MQNYVVINAVTSNPRLFESLTDGSTPWDRVIIFVESLPDIRGVLVLSGTDPFGGALPSTWRLCSEERWTPELFFQRTAEESDGAEHIFYFYADSPLLDSGLAAKLYDTHCRYFADYTFADGYPYGLTPEILKREVVTSLGALAKDVQDPLGRNSIFEVIQKDINSFDIETDIAPEDWRLLRLSLTVDTNRNTLLVNRFIEAGARDAASVLELVNSRRDLFRTLPAYVQVQVASRCPQACSYCPYPKVNPGILTDDTYMSAEKLERIASEVEAFSEDAVFSLSLWGEPALHPDLPALIEVLLRRPKFRVVIETSGIGWDEPVLSAIGEMDVDRIDWIISLDSQDPELYEKIRGKGYSEAQGFASRIVDLHPGRVWIQAVRTQENEEHLEAFYRHWKEVCGKVIIQKYDHFCHALEERKVTDLSPLNRLPCWHIMRDLSILIDGTVPLCREDLQKSRILGNIFTESLSDIWSRGQDIYESHVEGRFSGICEGCDEYYTYNF